jgi:ATP-dependent Clp protease, protease subunit
MEYCRKINIVGDIDETAYLAFVESLDGMLEIDETTDIFIELMSHGGDAMVALAFYDKIRSVKGKVTIHARGIVASAAVIILAAGDERIMSKNAWVMVHEDTVFVEEDARVSKVEANAKTARRLEDQWNTLLEERTKKTFREEWAVLHKSETHLSAKECLKLGLATRIV